MRQPTIITASQIKTFKDCRKRYYFAYDQLLKPIDEPKPLSFGKAYHVGLESLLRGEDFEQAISNLETELESIDETIAVEAIKAFDRHIKWREWDIQVIEEQFTVNLSQEVQLQGKIDGRIKTSQGKFIIEHKTTSSLSESYLHHLMWDDQATAYLLADRMQGNDSQGIMYNILQKPKLKWNDQKESREEYLQRIAEWFDKEERIKQHLVFRNENQIRECGKDLIRLAQEINRAKNDGTYYRNPNACQILGCTFRNICLEDTPECRQGEFTVKHRQNEELSQTIEEF